MTKKQKPTESNQEKVNAEKIHKRMGSLFESKEQMPASVSIQQAEEMKARINELESKLSQRMEPHLTRAPRSESTASAAVQSAPVNKPFWKLPGLSLRTRLPLTVIFLLIVAFLVGTFLSVRATRNSLTETLQGELIAQTSLQAEIIRSYLTWTKSMAVDLAAAAEVTPLNEKTNLDLIRQTLEHNDQIFGSTIAYEPYRFQSSVFFWSPYYSRGADGSLKFTQLGNAEYNYFQWDWYALPKKQNTPVLSPPYFDEGGGNIWMVTWSVPFYDDNGKFKGVATTDMSFEQTQNIVRQIEVGQQGYAFLVNQEGTVLGIGEYGGQYKVMEDSMRAAGTSQQDVEWNKLLAAMTEGKSGFVNVTDPQGNAMFVAYEPVGLNTGWYLALAYPQTELFQPAQQLQNTLILFSVLITVIASFILLFFTRTITRPVQELARQARQFSQGQFELNKVQANQPVQMETGDELKQLGAAFNQMVGELALSIQTLEARVADRTHNLELASEVGRTIAQKVGNVNEMLAGATEMIRSRFELYYTQVYLLDPAGRTLILRSGTGETGKLLLQRGHHLMVGTSSLNGRAVSEKKPVIVADTTKNKNFLPNPLLPNTRSEMAIPLIVGDKVLGVLDMQSEAPEALNEDNLAAFEVLAGQLSVAIQNAILFAQSEEARQQVEENVRRTVKTGWGDYLDGIERGERIGYLFDQSSVSTLDGKAATPVDGALHVPITVTGAPIGAIQVVEESRAWTPQDARIAQAAADQLARHIENLRLLSQAEKYQREAEQVSRRLTREGWETYIQGRDESSAGYTFNLNEVKSFPESGGGILEGGLEHPLSIRDEAIGMLAVDADAETITKEARELIEAIAIRLSGHIEGLRLSQQTEQALFTTQQISHQNELILDSAGEGIFGLNVEGDHTFVNSSAAELLGFSVDELIGRHSHSTWHHTKPDGTPYPDHECPIYDAIHTGTVRHGDEYFLRKDGTGISVTFTATPVREGDRITGAVVSFLDITERKQAEEAVRQGEARLRTLVDHAPEAIVVVDLNTGFFADPNENAVKLYGLSREDLVKVGPAQMSPPNQPDGRGSTEKALEKIGEAMEGRAPVFEWITRNAQGQDFPCEVRLVRLPGDRPQVRASVTDITERKKAQEIIAQRAIQLETVSRVSTTTATVLDPDLLLQTVVDLTRERFNLYHAHIYLADESWQTLLLAAGAGEVGAAMVAEEHAIAMDAEKSLVARAARERAAAIVNDVRADPGFLPNPLLPETRSEMAVPMIVGDKLLGVFDVQSDQANTFSGEDAHIYSTLAAQVAIALQNARLYVEQAATLTQLRELDRLKSSFLANMSHELRTPLNSILGFADVMLEELDGPLTENMNNDLRLIQKNGQHLLHLINDVLDMAKIEAGRMNLNPEMFRVQELLEDVTSLTSTLASEKNLSLFIAPDSDSNVEIHADRTRLRQVMINLVNNAIKFTDHGKISISTQRQGAESVLIRVHDTGIGIPPDKLETVFQEFTQMDTSTTRKVGGTGLGLPISRRLIEMHGGHLWAESTGVNGEGSTFFVELPIEAHIEEPEKTEK